MRLFPKSRKRRITVVALFAAYTLMMLFGGCADFFILHPSTDPIAGVRATRREVAVSKA